MTVGDIWYRYEDVAYSNGWFDVHGEWCRSSPTIKVEERQYMVIRETPKGVWVTPYFRNLSCISEEEKFIRFSSIKKYAYPTVEEAKKGFIARKNAQIRILSDGLHRAESALAQISKSENSIM